MGAADKKRELLQIKRGRPALGALCTYPEAISTQIRLLRQRYPYWGAISIRLELELEYGYPSSSLPSIASIDRYLKEQGFIKTKEVKSSLPASSKCSKQRSLRVHECWEMDAQGAIDIPYIGHHALINIKDSRSRVHCMAFPVKRKHTKSQPKTPHYYWALRLAFEQWGLPKRIQVDRDSVFLENTTRSPFPKTLHLWLIGLGVDLCFIKSKPPKYNAMIERTHQTMEKQILSTSGYKNWKALFQNCEKRRRILNEKMPNRMLNKKAPLQAFPKAIRSKRDYQIHQEHQLVEFKRIYAFLAKCTWFRRVSNTKTVSLGGQIYYLKKATPYTQVQVGFCNRRKKLLFRDVNELLIAQIPLKNLNLKDIMAASQKDLLSMKFKLFNRRKCPF